MFLDSRTTVGLIRHRKQPISFRSHREKLMCEGCQKHFKQLEDRVIPIYEQLERRETFTMTQEDQLVLSRWTLKTAICLLFADHIGDRVPPEDRYQLRQDGTIPPQAWIAYCAWDGVAGLGVNEFGVGDADNPTPYAYSVSLTTRRVGIKCFRRYGEPQELLPDITAGQLVQAWPLRDVPFRWPPAIAFNDFDLFNLIFR